MKESKSLYVFGDEAVSIISAICDMALRSNGLTALHAVNSINSMIRARMINEDQVNKHGLSDFLSPNYVVPREAPKEEVSKEKK